MSMPSSSPLPDGPMLRYDSWSSGPVIDVLLLEKCLSNDRTEDNRTSSCAGLLHRRKRLTTVSVKVVSHHPTNTEGPVPGRLERLGLLLVSRVLSANHGPRAMRIWCVPRTSSRFLCPARSLVPLEFPAAWHRLTRRLQYLKMLCSWYMLLLRQTDRQDRQRVA
ncbi:hypothetical protein HDV57DRAFT_415111 [Trichoderma longibrachiatum]|uniref:Uncharacterized protein n=1 Tax=Trichoderma longibrachiatum ATCC 18648 TaxID=983965 RepID=A0A2T4C2V0_TRILO|nr:hypothetical protein M440DRAFT_1262559 [Trichoderma longibrachiatum ATCC 18648]